MDKSRLISLLVTIVACADTIYGVLADNLGLLNDLGVPPVFTKVIMLIGLIVTAFSKSLTPKLVAFSPEDPKDGGGKVVPPTSP